MQVAAGVQGDHAGVCIQMLGAPRGHHVLMDVLHGQMVMGTERLPGSHQRGVVLQAGQALAGVQQTPAQVAFARAPVQPVARGCAEGEVTSEGFDLLPFAAGYIDVKPVDGGGKRTGGQGTQRAERLGGISQLWIRCGQCVWVDVTFGLGQGALAQMPRKFRVGAFPIQVQMGERPGFPQRLMLGQKPVKRLKAFEQKVAVEGGRHWERCR